MLEFRLEHLGIVCQDGRMSGQLEYALWAGIEVMVIGALQKDGNEIKTIQDQ